MRLVLRFAGSAGITAAIFTLLHLLAGPVLSFVLGIPGLIIAPLAIRALEWGFDVPHWLNEQAIEGPIYFAAVVGIAGFVFWWAIVFSLWPFMVPRRQPKSEAGSSSI